MDGLLVGRFQPFHLGHLHAVRYALSRTAPGSVWIAIGSAGGPPGPRNPFSAGERREMIESSLSPPELRRTAVYGIPDFGDHSRWAAAVAAAVPPFGAVFTNDADTAHVYGRRGVPVVPIPLEDRRALSGTAVRAMIAAGRGGWEALVPAGTRGVLRRCGAAARLAAL